MKNYRTTLIGAVLAALSFLGIYQTNGGDLAHWQQWLVPALIAALGYVAKDAGVTGSLKLLIACLALLTLSSCQHLGPLAKLGIAYGEKRNLLNPDDAEALRGVQIILLPEVTAKQPRNVQP